MSPLTDEAAQAERRERDKDRLRQWAEDVHAVMGTPAGRRFVYGLIYDIGGLEDVAGYGISERDAALHEGGRKMAQVLKTDIQSIAADEVKQMVLEQVEELARRARATPKPSGAVPS